MSAENVVSVKSMLLEDIKLCLFSLNKHYNTSSYVFYSSKNVVYMLLGACNMFGVPLEHYKYLSMNI